MALPVIPGAMPVADNRRKKKGKRQAEQPEGLSQEVHEKG